MKTGLPLSARLFLFTSLLLVVTLGTAIVITYQQGNAIAKAQLADQMSHAKVARQRVSDNRFDQLALIAELVAGDVDLVEYIETATGGGLGFGNSGGGSVDRRSALDLLLERQAQTRFDFAVLMDDQGEVLVRTDRAETTREVLTDSALVNYAVQEISTEYGVMGERRRLV